MGGGMQMGGIGGGGMQMGLPPLPMGGLCSNSRCVNPPVCHDIVRPLKAPEPEHMNRMRRERM